MSSFPQCVLEVGMSRAQRTDWRVESGVETKANVGLNDVLRKITAAQSRLRKGLSASGKKGL